MKNLVFHLGLTKTASSFLQKKVFHGKVNTLSRAIEWSDDQVCARDFKEEFLKISPYYCSGSELKRFLINNNTCSRENIVISHESLYNHIPFFDGDDLKHIIAEPFLVSARLKQISQNVWSDQGIVKAFFFFRKQSEWLPSVYAHICYQLSSPSQKDFNTRVDELISGKSSLAHVINYYILFEYLCKALGSQNVLALPYEALHEPETWEKLREFTGIDYLGRGVDLAERHINVKKLPGEADWFMNGQVQPFQSNVFVSKLRPIFKYSISADQRLVLKNFFKNTFGIEERRIGLDERRVCEVMRFYLDSNKMLSDAIEVPLDKYGYY